MTGFVIDKDYEQRVRDIVLEALMLGLKDDETGVSVWRTGEIVQALMMVQAMVLAGSPTVGTPTKLRVACEDFAKQLRRSTAACQANYAEHGPPFPTHVIEGELH